MSCRGINPLWFAYEGVGVVGCVGLPSACSLTWSDPARSSFRNLHVHSSPRQVEVPPRGSSVMGGEAGMSLMSRFARGLCLWVSYRS